MKDAPSHPAPIVTPPSPGDVTGPAPDTSVKFFTLGSDHVWCPDCKAWVGTEGDCSVDCEHPTLQVEMDEAPLASCADAQDAIDALYTQFREADDIAAASARALHAIQFAASRVLAGPKLTVSVRQALEHIVHTAIHAAEPHHD